MVRGGTPRSGRDASFRAEAPVRGGGTPSMPTEPRSCHLSGFAARRRRAVRARCSDRRHGAEATATRAAGRVWSRSRPVGPAPPTLHRCCHRSPSSDPADAPSGTRAALRDIWHDRGTGAPDKGPGHTRQVLATPTSPADTSASWMLPPADARDESELGAGSSGPAGQGRPLPVRGGPCPSSRKRQPSTSAARAST